MPIAEGAEFAGYSIIRLLGAGGMGEVYLAKHPRLPRLEALKVLSADVSADAAFRQRFAREADMAASLWHPNIIAVHDRGEFEGQLWITMDYVDGTDAARLTRDRYPRGMPLKEALEIVSAIADALDYAHERYLLHRDVKPGNILLTKPHSDERRIMLADFGIAKPANETHGVTATNMTVGSVAYAAPEQLMGKKLDGRADQYALACTAFHLLTGHQPFNHSNPAAVIGSHLSTPPPRLSSVRSDLAWMDGVLAKGMAKEPPERFGTCREFALALAHGDAAWERSTADTQYRIPAPVPYRPEPDTATTGPTEPPGSSASSSSRRTALVAIGVAALLAAGIVLGVIVGRGSPDPAPPIATPTQPTSIYREPTEPTEPRRPSRTETVTETSTVVQRPPPPPPPPASPTYRPTNTRVPGDLGLPTAMSKPLCNGQGIVVLGNATTPGQYREDVQRLLNAHPGASYLRTDQSCPSLRQADDEGDPIYAVYRFAGYSLSQVCAAVLSEGGGVYGKWLDYVHDPTLSIRAGVECA